LTRGKTVNLNPTWAASIEKQVLETRYALRGRDPADLANLSGAGCAIAGEAARLQLHFWSHSYVVVWPGLTVQEEDGNPCPTPIQAMLLQYLAQADGAPLENTWVSLSNLPNGAFYEQAFQGYSGNLIARTFRGDLESLRAAAMKLAGEPLEMGDLAYRFWAFPRIPLALVYWSGGEEFPDSAQVLFDRSASHYHHLEMLAHLGAVLCERLIDARANRSKM